MDVIEFARIQRRSRRVNSGKNAKPRGWPVQLAWVNFNLLTHTLDRRAPSVAERHCEIGGDVNACIGGDSQCRASKRFRRAGRPPLLAWLAPTDDHPQLSMILEVERARWNGQPVARAVAAHDILL